LSKDAHPAIHRDLIYDERFVEDLQYKIQDLVEGCIPKNRDDLAKKFEFTIASYEEGPRGF
jgi:hypothetical protein